MYNGAVRPGPVHGAADRPIGYRVPLLAATRKTICMTMPHHPVFHSFTPWSGQVEPGFGVNFLGVRTRQVYFQIHWGKPTPGGYRQTTYSSFDEEYFEWIDLLSAVVAATDRFTMIELGAGWGRWLVNSAIALKRLGRTIPCQLVGVEAEPQHFQWMQVHFRDNGLDPKEHRLIEAAAHSDDGQVSFVVGNADRWYGQSIVADDASVPYDPDADPSRAISKSTVKAVSLATLLVPYDRVDLVDLDVQGAELAVLEAAASQLDRKVRRVHIGTHAPDIEAGLRQLFGQMGWDSQADYACGSESDTPWGRISFQDGVQSWVNPRLA